MVYNYIHNYTYASIDVHILSISTLIVACVHILYSSIPS